jgi:Uma2 family endonuclease
VSTFDRLADLEPERVRPLKRVEYERLVEVGFFEGEHIELLNGTIYEKHASDRVRPLKRVEYERLVSEGLFDDERIELLGGVIVEMSPQDPRHAATVYRVQEALSRAVGSDKIVRVQLPFAASDVSEPEPDIAVVPRRDYDDAHPASAFLLVEVSNMSLRKDRALKGDFYALAAVPEYWVVSLTERQVEIRTEPSAGGYTVTTIARPGDTIRVASLGGLEISVSDFLR